MFYTIYQITNTINDKIYVGKHMTLDLNDGYMGSGTLIKRAIEKYGIDFFKKEIIHVFENEDDMNLKERELVTEEFCNREDTYNLCVGGKGGFSYINKNGMNTVNNKQKSPFGKEFYQKYKESIIAGSKKGNNAISEKVKLGIIDPRHFLGRSHTEETKKTMSLLKKGKNTGKDNSQFGSMWITNGEENKKIKSCDPIPDGWIKGRTLIR